MKIAYLTKENRYYNNNKGIFYKMDAFVSSLVDLGNDVDFFFIDNNQSIKKNIVTGKIKIINIFWKGLSRPLHYYYSSKEMLIEKYDYLLIRHMWYEIFIWLLIKIIKYKNSNIKIIVDYPTYPYYSEAKSLAGRFLTIMDYLFKYGISKCLHCCISTSPLRTIYGVRNVFYTNGIITSNDEINAKKLKDDCFIMIGIAMVSKWHGFDRIIRGLYEYYKNNPSVKCKFLIIGIGDALQELQTLTHELCLEDSVEFLGVLNKDEIRHECGTGNIGISSLGAHRIGLSILCPLKNREYCMQQMPFVFAGNDPDFPAYLPFVFNVELNDEPISIQNLLDFYNNLIITYPDYQNRMLLYGKENLSWQKKVQKIMAEVK